MNKKNKNIRTGLGHAIRYFALLPIVGSCARGNILQQDDASGTSQAHSNTATTSRVNICDDLLREIMYLGNAHAEAVVKLYDMYSYSAYYRDIMAKAIWRYWGGRFRKAVIHNHTAIVRILLDNPRNNAPINVNQTDDRGRTLLFIAVEHSNRAMVQLLVGAGADINQQVSSNAVYGETALHLAARYGDSAMVQLLIDLGADVNAEDNFGWRPLHRAARRGYLAVIQLLLHYGADVNAYTKCGGTAMQFVWFFSCGPFGPSPDVIPDIEQILINYGATDRPS